LKIPQKLASKTGRGPRHCASSTRVIGRLAGAASARRWEEGWPSHPPAHERRARRPRYRADKAQADQTTGAWPWRSPTMRGRSR
jgi:hypothetical protein